MYVCVCPHYGFRPSDASAATNGKLLRNLHHALDDEAKMWLTLCIDCGTFQMCSKPISEVQCCQICDWLEIGAQFLTIQKLAVTTFISEV